MTRLSRTYWQSCTFKVQISKIKSTKSYFHCVNQCNRWFNNRAKIRVFVTAVLMTSNRKTKVSFIPSKIVILYNRYKIWKTLNELKIDFDILEMNPATRITDVLADTGATTTTPRVRFTKKCNNFLRPKSSIFFFCRYKNDFLSDVGLSTTQRLILGTFEVLNY